MNYLLPLLIVLSACGQYRPKPGPAGPPGESITGQPGAPGRDGIDGHDGIDGTNGRDGIDGTNGRDGVDGTSCTVTQLSDGAVITCPDGTEAFVADGDSCKDKKDKK